MIFFLRISAEHMLYEFGSVTEFLATVMAEVFFVLHWKGKKSN